VGFCDVGGQIPDHFAADGALAHGEAAVL
jgi:hypothetical protein